MGIKINQSLKLKDHENKIRGIEKHLCQKAKLLGRILNQLKEKYNFWNNLKSKLSYGIEPLIRHDPKYQS